MTTDLALFLETCRSMQVDCATLDVTNSAFVLQFGAYRHLIANRTFGLNSDIQATFCRDKFYHYQLLHSIVSMPTTIAYFDPQSPLIPLRKFATLHSYGAIVSDIVSNFDLPVIVKKNQGSKGEAVYLCHHQKEITTAVESVFNQQRYFYDYMVLAQSYISHKSEYRVIWFDGKVRFAYMKDISTATCEGNLSPLHWNGARSVLVTDSVLLRKFTDLMGKIQTVLPITYCGADFVMNTSGDLCLLELNHAPGFDEYLKTASDQPLRELYTAIITYLMNRVV
jgi:glutathione synthase/RimK-type ligase-like ATP-grasp enzyme